MEVENNNYNLEFKISSQDNLVKFITNETSGKGFSKGKINENVFIPKNYQYIEKKRAH